MPNYEVRFLNERGTMVWSQPISAEGDLLAIGIVLQSDSPHAKELWLGERKVMEFSPDDG